MCLIHAWDNRPIFFVKSQGQATNVSGENYRRMITDSLLPNDVIHCTLHTRGFNRMGTTHTARASMNLLRENYPQKLTSRFGNIPWPTRSPDLTPIVFLWDYFKEMVYNDNHQSVVALKKNIHREISSIEPNFLQRVAQNTWLRFEQCVQLNGRHLDDILLKNEICVFILSFNALNKTLLTIITFFI